MGMTDRSSTETRLQKVVAKAVDDHQKLMAEEGRSARYRADALRELISEGWASKNRDLKVPPRFIDKFDKKADRVGFGVTKTAKVYVENYASRHGIEYQQSYFEFICCGLHRINQSEPI